MLRRNLLYGFVIALVAVSLFVGWQWKSGVERIPSELGSAANKMSTRAAAARDMGATVAGSHAWREQWAQARGQSPARDAPLDSTFQGGVGAADIAAVIKRLSNSASPNDWYKAAALNILCIGTSTHRRPESTWLSEGRKDYFRKLGEPIPDNLTSPLVAPALDRANRQCGEAGASPLIVEHDVMGKAARQGSALALASLSEWRDYMEGLSSEQQKLILAALADSEGRTAWIALNQSRLARLMEASGTFPETSYQEMRAALTLSLCYFGDDCSNNSLHMVAACPALLGCSGNVEDAVFASLPPHRQGAVTTIAIAIVQRIQQGDLNGIGLTVSKARPPVVKPPTPAKPPGS